MESSYKQTRRQSSDFNEIWNTQTELKVTQEHWDNIFHNWTDPKNCQGNKRVLGCKVCSQLETIGYAIDKRNSVFGVNVAVIGDLHSNYKDLHTLIDSDPSLCAAICVGDLALWKEEIDAEKDIKAFFKMSSEIKEFINNHTPFKIPVYVVKGNHDDFENMYSGWFKDLNIFYVNQADVLEFNNLKVGFLGGIYSPKRTKLDASSFQGRDKRFYTLKEIDELKTKQMDMLVTHQAAKGVLPSKFIFKDEGSECLKELLDAIKPSYYVHGHHHKNYVADYEAQTFIIGLGNFAKNPKSYFIINTLTKEVK